MTEKISVIGAGDIGMNISEILALKNYHITLFNRYNEEHWLAKQGLVMDLNDALYLPNCGKIRLTHNLSDLNNSICCIITAGAKRKSIKELRHELASRNAEIMDQYVELIANNPNCLFMIVTNPVDLLTRYLIEKVAEYTNQNKDIISKRIIGVSYIDTMRMYNIITTFLEQKYPNECYANISGIAIGEHGPSMVPVMSNILIDNKHIYQFANDHEIEELKKHIIFRGNDIINLTGNSSVKGPAHAAMHLADSVISNKIVSIPSCCWDGERAIGQLAKFVDGKFHSVIELELTNEEQNDFGKSCNIIDEQYQNMIQYLKTTNG